MAGFWTGLVHGTLMCGATLAALSLAFPREDAGEGPAGAAGAGGMPASSSALVRAGPAAPAPDADRTAGLSPAVPVLPVPAAASGTEIRPSWPT